MTDSIVSRVYPEKSFGGFTRCDGTVAFYARVQSLLKPDQIVLDVGCGRAAWTQDACEFQRALRDLRGAERRVIGVDVDAAAAANPTIDDFRLIEDVAKWPVRDEFVDVVVSDYVLEHVEATGCFFSELMRVLKPGGYVCIRTPNALGYVALVARLVPNRFHPGLVAFAQHGRRKEDVFRTVYRCNTQRRLNRALRREGFLCCVYTFEGEPLYLRSSDVLFRIGACIHGLLPSAFRSTLFAFAQKPIGLASSENKVQV